MIVVFSVTVGLLFLVFILMPFWMGEGGSLESSAALNSVEKVEAVKVAFLKRYLKEEKAVKDEIISESAWKQRKQFLINRYIDLSRRGDFLKQNQSTGAKK